VEAGEEERRLRCATPLVTSQLAGLGSAAIRRVDLAATPIPRLRETVHRRPIPLSRSAVPLALASPAQVPPATGWLLLISRFVHAARGNNPFAQVDAGTATGEGGKGGRIEGDRKHAKRI
jgi:hypothetical protein